MCLRGRWRSNEEGDNACVFGAGQPMGPFQLLDLTGIDPAFDVDMGKFKEMGNFVNLPIPTIVKLHTEGQYGQKTEKAFTATKSKFSNMHPPGLLWSVWS